MTIPHIKTSSDSVSVDHGTQGLAMGRSSRVGFSLPTFKHIKRVCRFFEATPFCLVQKEKPQGNPPFWGCPLKTDTQKRVKYDDTKRYPDGAMGLHDLEASGGVPGLTTGGSLLRLPPFCFAALTFFRFKESRK